MDVRINAGVIWCLNMVMAQYIKRRFTDQLPVVNQTDTLKNFFGSTVDNLFQPGTSEPISGYIGQKPIYYDPTKDFYLAEDTDARAFYQLEPAMISMNSGGIITDTLTYDDLINYLSSQGALTNNHSRMFEGDYYSWAPPVDLDKLNNYLQYVWMGSLTDEEANSTVMTLRSPRNTHAFDGNTTTYALPPAIQDFNGTGEVPMVLVNGVQVDANIGNGVATISAAGLVSGDIIEVMRYGDLATAFTGRTTLDFSPFLAWTNVSADYTTKTLFNTVYNVGDLVYGTDAYGVGAIYTCTAQHIAASLFYVEILNYWKLASNAQFATTGSRVRLVDGIGSTVDTARYFFIDGVGQAIDLTPDFTSHVGGSAPQYIVIDRRSKDKSPWTQRNLWVHKMAFDWANVDLSYRTAKRPIIEFLPNIELYNYGSNRLPDVQGVLSNATAGVVDNWDVYPFDDGVWDIAKIQLSQINGQFFGRLHDSTYNGGTTTDSTYIGSVVVDTPTGVDPITKEVLFQPYVLQPNDRLFVNQSSPDDPATNNQIYTVVSVPDVPLPSGASADLVELVATSQPQRGDIFKVSPPSSSVFSDPIEYWYDGIQWKLAQNGSTFPLFRLYDANQNPLDDTSTYPGNNFSGFTLFAYQTGNGVVDPILGFPVNYNSYNQPIFEIDSVINRVTYDGGTIPGYYYHHFVDTSLNGGSGSFSNNWFPIANASTQSIVDGFYEVPLNLQANPGNLEVTTISRNQWFDQFSTIMTSQANFVGQPYSVNNWRDTAKILDYGNEILQHRSPLLKTMLLSADTNFDLPASLTYTELEYVRYRNKFVQTILDFYRNGTLLDTDLVSTWVSQVLVQQRINKNNQFPYAGSTMAGGQYFMPPTPASLGIAQVAIPGLVSDTTFSTPINMIRGHDGSLTPAFNDFRDQIIVALEQTIYDNIPSQFKTEARPVFDQAASVGGKFYSSVLSYSQAEITEMITPVFLRWVQANRIDYRTNTGYDSNNPFSWNYSTCFDKDGDALPGFWRGIYRLYYDTDRPHLAPWEMLGFIDKPSWWQAQYGPAPYTSGNTKLWDDLRDGNIAGGPRQGIDLRYARPGLYSYIPVDQEGRLIDPIAAGIVATPPAFQQASANWVVGDFGPVESLWRTSSSFGFAMALAGFLSKPSRFVEEGWDTINQVQDATGQWIYAPTGDRPINSNLYVHGETGPNGKTVVATGIQQWISDYMVSRGQPPSNLGNSIRGLDVRLAHKMAGFVSADNLTVSADNFGLVPAEDYSVIIYNSPSTREEVYSGVLIERTNNGWRIIGYDTRSPWFTVIPGVTTGPKGSISLASSPEPTIMTWKPNVYYPNGINVNYQNTVYKCSKGHTSGQTFNNTYWTLIGPLPQQAPRVTTYLVADTTTTVTVPYGTLFTTYQQVADFLTGYGRYLTSRGWIFEGVDPRTQESLDWNLMTKEFLGWAQVTWQAGNFITLSPAANEAGLVFSIDQGYALNVLNPINGIYGMTDRAGLPISRRNVIVNRIDDTTTLLSKNNDIYGARINIAEIEHILLFNDLTIFNDIMYAPLFNLRQPRFLLIGFRSSNWAGRLDAPGYILLDNQIKSNFYKAANDLVTMFDIEKGDNATLVDHARHVIGYDSRDYLSTLVLSEVEQFEFYQGMIHQKGSPGAFDKLLRSDFIDQNRNLMFFEEWAILLSEYGAVNNQSRISFLFGQTNILRDPQIVEFRVVGANSIVSTPDANWISLVDNTTTGLDSKWIERPPNPLMAFPTRQTLARQPGDLPVAGYVRLDEVDHTVFSSDQVEAIYDANAGITLDAGEVVWIHENTQVRNLSTNGSQVENWYLLGVNTSGGFWDGSNTRTLANAYTEVDNGQLVFVSHANDAPFVTDDDQFVPIPGQTYTVTFNVRKTVKETDGIPTYVRPAFDAFDANGVISGALGVKNGVGYNSSNDLIDTSNWVVGTWYSVTATWMCPTTPVFVSARGRIRVNRTYPTDDASTQFSNAIYEVNGSDITINQPVEWDALKIYNMSADGSINTIANVATFAEDSTISNTSMRIYTLNAHGLTNSDQGLFFIVDGQSLSDSELQGVHTILDVGPSYIEVAITGKHGYDFSAKGLIGPELRIMRSIHFENMDQFNANKDRSGVQDGDIAYVDGAPWNVYQRTSVIEQTGDYTGVTRPITYSFWNSIRSQPLRVDGTKIKGSTVYDLKTKITTTDLRPQPLTLNYLTVISPLTGVVPGLAMTEIDYLLDYDPAFYNNVPNALDEDGNSGFVTTTNSVDKWGPAQVGRVWWNLSTVRFLETETDNVVFGVTGLNRYNSEVNYRANNWGAIAPATSVDVYEWIRSTVTPLEYMALAATDTTGTYVGEVYNFQDPSWIQSEEYVNNKPTTFYYFWVKGLDVVPDVPFRTRAVSAVAQFIVNPMVEDEPWIAPVMPNGVLVGGVKPFVDDVFDTDADGAAISGTVVQIDVEEAKDDVGVIHEEWFLLRPGDELSTPPNWLWDKFRDSLVGFDINQLPSPPTTILPETTPPANKLPIWYTGPGPNDVPIT